MNPWLLAASVVLLVVGAVHSVLGERLVFARLRRGGWAPTEGGGRLREPHLRILWATWHGATVQLWAVAAVMGHAAQAAVPRPVMLVLVAAVGVGGLLVLAGTRGRHPGWMGLGAAALLAWRGLG